MSKVCINSKFVIFCCQCMWSILLSSSNAISEVMSLSLRVQVAHVYSSTLITHVLVMLNFVRVLMYMLLHTFLNPAITPVARAILHLISLLQSLSQGSSLPRYTDSRDIFNSCATDHQFLYDVLLPKHYSHDFLSVDL